MRFRGLALGVLVGAGVCMADAAAAQQEMPNIVPKRDLKIGVRAAVAYDDNVSRSSKAVAAIRGLKLADYTFTPAATITLVQPIGPETIFVTGDGGYVYYKENKDLNSVKAAVNGGVLTRLGICKQAFTASYRASQNELSNIDLGTAKNVQEATSIGAGLQCATPAGLGASTFVSRTETTNQASIRRESDTTLETLSLGAQYGRPSLGFLSLNFNYASTEFPNRITFGRPIGDSFFTQSYGVGYQRAFGTRLQVGAQASTTHVKREFAPPGVDTSFNTPTFAADVTYGFGPRITISANAARTVVPSQQLGKTYDKNTSYGLTGDFKAGSRLSFRGGALRQKVDSNIDSSIVLGPVVTSQRVSSVYGSVTYSPGKLWSVTLDVRHDERKANLPDFNYTSNRVGVTTQATF
jgi:hypothetical protein